MLIIFLESQLFICTQKEKTASFSWNNRPSKLVYDPMLNVLSNYISNTSACDLLIIKKREIKSKIEEMFIKYHTDFNGRNNNKSDVIRRKELYKDVFESILKSNAI